MPNYGRWLPGSGQFGETTDVHIHYSFEPQDTGTQVNRWLVLDITMPLLLLPLRQLILRSSDMENLRTIAAVKKQAEAYPDGSASAQATR